MKKASMLVLSLLVLAAFAMVACTEGDSNEVKGYKNPKKLTTEWQIFYLKVVDASRPDGAKNLNGLERFHFHYNVSTYGEAKAGLEIQKIFTSSTMSATIPANATIVVDYTQTDPDVNTYDPSFADANRIGDVVKQMEVGTSSGRVTTSTLPDDIQKWDTKDEWKYLGNVGSGALADTVYVGFVMRNVSAAATGERINIICEGSTLQGGAAGGKGTFQLWQWFGLDYGYTPPVVEPDEDDDIVNEWTTVYKSIPADVQILSFHVGTGSVQIQKIFVVNGSGTEIPMFDFTKTPAYNATDFWWGADSVDSLITDGMYVLESEGDYKGGARFGSGLIVDNPKVGFVIKSPKGLGDARFLFEIDGTPATIVDTVRFSDLINAEIVSGFNFTEWTAAWLQVIEGKNTFNFHANDCYIEIQKILINDSATMTGATVLFDFTAPEVSGDESGIPYWWANYWGQEFVKDGRYIHDVEGGWVYGGGFATNQSFNYIGYIFKTNTEGLAGLGDFRVEQAYDGDADVKNFKTFTFENLK